MGLSRGEQVIDAMIARLQLPDDLDPIPEGLEDLVVEEYTLRPQPGTRIQVYPLEAGVGDFGEKLVTHDLIVGLELLRAIPEGMSANKAIDPLYVWSMERLFADRPLGKLVDWLREHGRAWAAREGEEGQARLLVKIVVKYRALAAHPDRRA